jgi:Tol biopolymer transport system component
MHRVSGSTTVTFATAAWVLASVATSAQMHGPNLHPSWSPDGRAIVFERTTDGDSEIVVMNVASGTTHQLTHNEVDDGTPVWEGRTIYFRSDRDGTTRWYQMDIDGRRQQPAPNGPSMESRSTDGRICVSEGTWNGGLAIFRCDPGKTPWRLTGDRHGEQPVVSADGRYVLYENRDTDPAGIYMMNADGSERHRVSDGTDPTWSPNGQVALFKSLNNDGAWEVTVYDLRSREKRLLGLGVHPAFSPDGRQILFMSGRSGRDDIWLMSESGADLKCLTCQAR